MNLDSIVSRTPKQPPFCVAGLLDYIVGLIVREDEVSRILFAFLRRSPCRNKPAPLIPLRGNRA